VCFQAGDRERERFVQAVARSEAWRRSPGWRRSLALLRAWAKPGCPIHDHVNALWLEFDAEGAGVPEPFLIFTLDGERLYPGGTALVEDLLATVATGIDALTEGAIDPLTTAALDRCLRGLPPFAQLRHVAVRPTPSGDVVRLVVRMPWSRLASTLADLGWPGDREELRTMLERLCADKSVHPVNLDVTCDGLGPRVGIEFAHAGAPAESTRWQVLFDLLETSGACAPERRAAIAGWGGELRGPRSDRASSAYAAVCWSR
jgi:hypothetical protein